MKLIALCVRLDIVHATLTFSKEIDCILFTIQSVHCISINVMINLTDN
jgi:hypothetical protein